MNTNQTKNSALTTALAFHYQALVAIQECFSLEDGQSIYIETDGDISIAGNSIDSSIQTEVKHFSDELTDHHINFWKTLDNWLDHGFNQTKYGLLILHTTQVFGSKTLLKAWNEEKPEGRLKILEQICSNRNFAAVIDPKALTGVVKHQYSVMMEANKDTLKAVITKMTLYTEALDLDAVRLKLTKSLEGYIPQANQQAYIEGMIGFVYERANHSSWEISKEEFINKRMALTGQYSLQVYSVRDFNPRSATDQEVEEHAEAEFVKKICEIEYDEVLPVAIANWLELQNSLDDELEGYPQYQKVTRDYQMELVTSFQSKYRTACRNDGDFKKHSQNLYDEVISDNPRPLPGYPAPSLTYKNGLIHDAMDNVQLKLKWKVKND